MKNVFCFIVKKSVKIFYNKAMCLSIAFCMLFNLSAPAFAGFNFNNEEKQAFAKLNETLQEEYANQELQADPTAQSLTYCLENKDKKQCEKYVNLVNAMFTDIRQSFESYKDIDEEKEDEEEKPLSRKQYNKDFEKYTEEEYNKQLEELDRLFKQEERSIKLKYYGVSLNNPRYNDSILEKSNLDQWRKDNITNLTAWKKEALNSKEKYYQKYLKDFEKSKQEYKEEQTAVQNEFFRTLANNLMLAYNKDFDIATKAKFIEIITMLLSMESDTVKFFTKEQRGFIANLFRNSLKNTPCKCHTRKKTEEESPYYKEMRERAKKIREQRNEFAKSDQVAAQTRNYKENIDAAVLMNEPKAESDDDTDKDTDTVTEPIDKEACNIAMNSLTGLSFFKKYDMSVVLSFMLDHIEEPTAAEIVLMGIKVILETNNAHLLYGFLSSINHKANDIYFNDDHKEENEMTMLQTMFFDDKFYKYPYNRLRFEDGTDVWQDIAEMLSQYNNDPAVRNVEEYIVRSGISFISRKEEIYFGANVPLIYGLLLHEPSAFNGFVPDRRVYQENEDEGFSHTFATFQGHSVKARKIDDTTLELYITDGKSIVYLHNDDIVYETHHDSKGNKIVQTKKAGDLRKECLEEAKNTNKKDIEKWEAYLKTKHAEKIGIASIVAEAFYNTKFADLAPEEKLAMDNALAKVYPKIKKKDFAEHEKKLKRTKGWYTFTNVTVKIIDVGFTIWCLYDIYKLGRGIVRGIRGFRALIKASRIASGLSTARKIKFFRIIVKSHPNILAAHKRWKNIRTITSRVANKYPTYSQGLPLMRVSHDGNRVLQVTKLNGTPVMVGQATLEKTIKIAATAAKVAGPIDIVTNDSWWNRLRKKAGKSLEYSKIGFNDEGILEVDGDLLKVFKAVLKPENIAKYKELIGSAISNLEKTLLENKARIEFLAKEFEKGNVLSAEELAEYEKFKNMQKLLEALKDRQYVTLRINASNKLSYLEKMRKHKSGYKLVNLYDAQGNVVYQVSLDMAYNTSVKLQKALEAGQKLVLKNGKIFLGDSELNATVGVTKEVISLLARAGKKVEDFDKLLTLYLKNSKMGTLIFNNALTFSAASTSLNMSLNESPFNNPNDPYYVSQGWKLGISVGFPYAFSFLSPMVTPFVKRFGAANVQIFSLMLASAGMTYASLNGYNGFATKKKDAYGNVMYDENGKTILVDKAPSYWPLVISSFTAGCSSALTRASLNVAFNFYKTSKSSMAVSMVAKNIGSLAMTAIPWAMEFKYGNDNVDFSISYPWLAGLAMFGGFLMWKNIPAKVAREVGYKIMPNKYRTEKWTLWKLFSYPIGHPIKTAKNIGKVFLYPKQTVNNIRHMFSNPKQTLNKIVDVFKETWKVIPRGRDIVDLIREISKPFGLFASSKVWPYYAAFLSFGATESYGLFTTYNIFAKDNVNNMMSDTGVSKNTNKLIASSLVTLPSFLVRRFVQRKTGFSQGIVNNVLLTTAGTIGLMIPSEDLSPAANVAIGATSGILIGSGTAHMYQYLQNRMLASVTKDMSLIRKYGSVTGLKTTAQSFYSGANIGLALPLAYSIVAENQKVAEVEKAQFSHDFKVNQKTLPIAFGVYGFGTVPLLRHTPVGKAMSISKFISFPYGAYGIYDLIDFYKRYKIQKHEYSIYTFNLNKQKPLGKINLQLPEPEVYPISYNGISPLPQTNNSSNQK